METPKIETCKKCNLPVKEGPGILEWCACEIGVDIDENGEPLDTCNEHGIYSGGGSCPGCDEIEHRIDDAIERDHQKRGNIKW